MKKIFGGPWSIYIVMSLSLGLAPWFPEPHIWGKLKWLAGGAVGMGPIDYFDTVFHGAPWLLLIGKGIYSMVSKEKKA